MKRTYEVAVECIVRKLVLCEGENLTVEEVANNPWEYAENEREMDQIDWEVIQVTDTTPKEKE